MLKKLSEILYSLIITLFIILLTNFYFSETNLSNINKSRSYHLINLENNANDLPFLPNNTSNIIEYTNDIEDFKKKKIKRHFWNLLNIK